MITRRNFLGTTAIVGAAGTTILGGQEFKPVANAAAAGAPEKSRAEWGEREYRRHLPGYPAGAGRGPRLFRRARRLQPHPPRPDPRESAPEDDRLLQRVERWLRRRRIRAFEWCRGNGRHLQRWRAERPQRRDVRVRRGFAGHRRCGRDQQRLGVARQDHPPRPGRGAIRLSAGDLCTGHSRSLLGAARGRRPGLDRRGDRPRVAASKACDAGDRTATSLRCQSRRRVPGASARRQRAIPPLWPTPRTTPPSC